MAFLHGVEVVEIDDGLRPIRTVRTGIIGLVGTAPKGPRNVPTLVAGDRTRGAALFGGTGDPGTIPDALDAIFAQVGAVVVVVNVLDPATDRAPVAQKAYDDVDGVYTLDDRYVANVEVRLAAGVGAETPAANNYALDAAAGTLTIPRDGAGAFTGALSAAPTIHVSYDRIQDERATVTLQATDEPLVIDRGVAVALDHPEGVSNVAVRSAAGGSGTLYTPVTHYTVDAAAGTITGLAASGAPADAATVYVSYRYTEERGVLDADVVGGSQGDGALTGISALLAAKSVLGHEPKILAAPGRSDSEAVAAALVSAADRLRGVAVIEGPSTTDAEAQAYRRNFGARRAYLVDPGVKVTDADDQTVDRPVSPYVAGVIARSDAERGFWWSPSNRLIAGIVGTSRDIDFALGDPAARANLLNEHEVATIIRENGYRLWGNRTCSADAKWAFLSVVRTADAINESILRAHLWAVDRNITRTYLTDVADGVNAYIADLVGTGALLAGRCDPSPDLNTPASIAGGQAYFDVDFQPPYPAERITFRSRLVNDLVEIVETAQ